MTLVERNYYVANGDDLDRAIVLLSMPCFALSVERELIEMDYSKITVTCLENQLMGVEHILENIV